METWKIRNIFLPVQILTLLSFSAKFGVINLSQSKVMTKGSMSREKRATSVFIYLDDDSLRNMLPRLNFGRNCSWRARKGSFTRYSCSIRLIALVHALFSKDKIPAQYSPAALAIHPEYSSELFKYVQRNNRVPHSYRKNGSELNLKTNISAQHITYNQRLRKFIEFAGH